MQKSNTTAVFKVLSSHIYLRGKSAPWLKIPAGSNAWFLILKYSSPRKWRSQHRSHRQNRRQLHQSEGCRSWSCEDTIPFQRNMQIDTLMHQKMKEHVNHLNAKYKDWYRLLHHVWTNMTNVNSFCITKPD